MSRKDQITGKRKNRAKNVSHSKRRTNRTQEVNLQKKRFFLAEENRYVVLKVSARTLRTIQKRGLAYVLKQHQYSL